MSRIPPIIPPAIGLIDLSCATKALLYAPATSVPAAAALSVVSFVARLPTILPLKSFASASDLSKLFRIPTAKLFPIPAPAIFASSYFCIPDTTSIASFAASPGATPICVSIFVTYSSEAPLAAGPSWSRFFFTPRTISLAES